MKTNKKYIYWAIALLGIYLLYRWWSKRNGNGGSPLSMAGAGIIGGSNNVVPPVESQSGSNTDTTIARSIMPIFESTEQRINRANAMDSTLNSGSLSRWVAGKPCAVGATWSEDGVCEYNKNVGTVSAFGL